jgi:hypothetical protein
MKFPYLLTPWWTLFEKLTVTQLIKKYPASFMELEGSLPCSQKPTIGPYSEPAESSSSHRSQSPQCLFPLLGRAKESAQVEGALKHFVTIKFFLW